MSDVRSVAVTVRIAKDAESRFAEVIQALEAAGLVKAEPRTRFLMVQGDVAPGKLEALRAVAGVASVREDSDYKAQER